MDSSTPLPFPPQIRVERPAPDILRYVLPPRALGKYRWLAVLPLAFAAFGIIFTWGWLAPLAQMQWPFGSLIWSAFCIVFVGGTVVVPIAIAAAILWGHSSIEIRGAKLWAVEHVGIFRWGHKRPLAQIRRLLVGAPNEKHSPRDASESEPAGFAAIHIETIGGKSRLAAMGYPRNWLLPLAHELAKYVRAAQPDLSDPTVPGRPQVDVVNLVEVAAGRGPVQRFEQPEDSRIVMTQNPDSLTFEVPPSGIKQGAGCLFAFACFWLGFTALFTTAFVFGNVQQPQPGVDLPTWTFIPLLALFWLIGIGLMLGAIHAARRRSVIAVAEGRCLVVQAGLFGEKKQVWETDELTAVQVGPSRIEVNDEPVLELQFWPRGGETFGLLSGHDKAELEWLATHLSKALALEPIRPGAAIRTDIDTQPPRSNVICEQLPGALTIRIPRSPFRQGPLTHWRGAVISAVVWTIMTAVLVIVTREFNAPWESFFPFVVLTILGAVVVGMFGVAIHMTIRRAEIALAGGRLLVLQFGLFGKRRHEWPVEELVAIRSAVSDTKVNNRPLMWLQVVPTDGKTVSLLTGRDEQELAWIATILRRELKLPAETEAERGA